MTEDRAAQQRWTAKDKWNFFGFIVLLPLWMFIAALENAYELWCHAIPPGEETPHECGQKWRRDL
jgi:hypothetical protein